MKRAWPGTDTYLREFMYSTECIYSEPVLGDIIFDNIGLVFYWMSVMEWERKCASSGASAN